MRYVDWLLPTTHHIAWLFQLLFIQVDPPDDEQQARSKQLEAYYWNKLIENSAERENQQDATIRYLL